MLSGKHDSNPTRPSVGPCWLIRALAALSLALPAAFVAITAAALPSPAAATTVSMGYAHGCSATDTNELRCWGSLPAQDQGTSGVKDVKAGRDFACALLLNDAVRCWGNNDFLQLGRPAEPGVSMAGRYQPDQIAVGARHACLRMRTTVACWGDASQGQIGYEGGQAAVADATRIEALSDAQHVAAGKGSTCAVMQNGTVRCIGAGSGLLDGTSDPRLARLVPGIFDAQEVALFDGHACVLRKGGKVSCWGSNLQGELGLPASSARVVLPVEVAGLPAPARAVAVGDGFTCALLATGRVACWGSNARGQLGTALGDAGSAGVVTGITDATAITAGSTAACAALQGGTVQCWGEGAGWSQGACQVQGGIYPGVPASFEQRAETAICRPQGSAAPLAVPGLGPEHDAAQVLDWAENTLPQTFTAGSATAPSASPAAATDPVVNLYTRTYAGGHRLAVNGHGTPHLLYQGPYSAGQVHDLGPLDHWLQQASRDQGLQSGLRMQAGAGFNMMPSSGPCWPLQTGYSIRAAAGASLPDGVVPTRIRIESAGQAMDLPITQRMQLTMLVTETEWLTSANTPPGGVLPPGTELQKVYYGMAHTCPTISIQKEVDITLFYTLGNRKGQLRARATVGSIA